MRGRKKDSNRHRPLDGTVRYGMGCGTDVARCGVVLYGVRWCDVVWYGIGMVWYGMGIVWYGMGIVWGIYGIDGLVRQSMVWYGMVCGTRVSQYIV